jgi:hypothetical protein
MPKARVRNSSDWFDNFGNASGNLKQPSVCTSHLPKDKRIYTGTVRVEYGLLKNLTGALKIWGEFNKMLKIQGLIKAYSIKPLLGNSNLMRWYLGKF